MPVEPNDLRDIAHRLILVALYGPLYHLSREELLRLALEFDLRARELERLANQREAE